MREDEAVDSFASMFQAGFAAEPERIEKRLRSERRSSLTAKAAETRCGPYNSNQLSLLAVTPKTRCGIGQAPVRPGKSCIHRRRDGGRPDHICQGHEVRRRGITMRWVYIGAGLLAISASCYMAVVASGGILSSSAPGLIAMAVILGVGAASIGHALAGGHTGIAVVIGLGMMAGEGGAMLQTAQRVTAAREAMRAPIAALVLKRQAALKDLAKAETVKPILVDHSRVDAAVFAKAEAEKAVRDKSADAGCRQNCRLLLQSAVDAAQRELEAARADMARQEADQSASIAKRIEVARAVVAALPPPQSSTPLADYTGVPEWLFDVFEALTLSFSINLPASALIALGVKMGRTPERDARKPTSAAIVLEEEPQKAENGLKPMLPPPSSQATQSRA